MKKLLLLSLAIASPFASAKTECTSADQAQWQDQGAFQEGLKAQGYQIRKFKVTAGNCYEIYGYDQQGRKVEIYFDPVSGKPVKERIGK